MSMSENVKGCIRTQLYIKEDHIELMNTIGYFKSGSITNPFTINGQTATFRFLFLYLVKKQSLK